MITIITGQAPNLPWWRALKMSDVEIAEYNRKFLKETTMDETGGYCSKCNTVWAAPGKCR